MNDEQFEQEQLDRDNAYKQALARVEAERDRLAKRLCICHSCGGRGEVHTGQYTDEGQWQPPEPVMVECGECGGDGQIGQVIDLDTAQAQLAEAVQILRMEQGARIDSHFPYTQKCVEGFLSVLDNAQAEQQEAQSPMAEIAEGLRQKAADEWPNHPSNPANQEAQGAQASEFQREDRYIVIKRKDLEAIEKSGEASDLETHEAVRFLAEALDTLRPHLPAREYLVIESDWPEYEPTWAAIQARVIFAERRQVRDISEEEKQAIADRLKSLPTALRGNDYDQ